MSIDIPPALADLQWKTDAAVAAIGAYEDEVGKPSLQWTPEETARLGDLWDAARAAAGELQRGIVASGLQGDGFEFQRALKAAARGEA